MERDPLQILSSGLTVGSGALARAAGVTRRAVRYYEEKCLLGPAEVVGGQARYGWQALVEVRRIRLLQEAGLSLEEIAEALRSIANEPPTRRQRQRACDVVLARAERELEGRIQHLTGLLSAVRAVRRTNLVCDQCRKPDCQGCATFEQWMRFGY